MPAEFSPAALQILVDRQYGLVTAAQLHALGFPPSRTRQRVETGRWQRVLHGVYAITSGLLTREAILEAALLYGGTAALLSHRTAAELWGMAPVDEAGPVHVTVPYGVSAIGQAATVVGHAVDADHVVPAKGSVLHPGVVVHRSRAQRHIGAADLLPPRTTRADTALDVAIAQPSAREAYVSLIRTVTNARVRLDDIRRRMQERTPRRYRKALEAAVRLMAEGVQSMLEYHFAVDVEHAHGLPMARRQAPVVVDGRTLWEDCDYTEHGVPLIVRLDGRRAHSMREVAFRDRRRDNAAELADRPRLVFGFEEVTGNPCGVAQDVERVLRREGWIRRDENTCRACARRMSPDTRQPRTGGGAA
ncbi:type IV toxin-antitoxin system AbiEi family antitoxin domain-containing protein [Rhodococcus daqingensis]|uniref:Type IV toxin-antitoxin system AbiEi family antitoxin domain-containing protein n=1 Tax=Rhodococcus daqingensis TaxID=2479363 RepID=A0ABW2RXI7_9NOCA